MGTLDGILLKGKWLLTFYKYLKQFQPTPEKALFEKTEFVGKALSYAYRLRGLEVIDYDKARSFAIDLGIGDYQFEIVLSILRKHGLIDYDSNHSKILEKVYSLDELIRKASEIWEGESPNDKERIALSILFLVSLRPHTKEEIFEELLKEGFKEEDSKLVLEILSNSFRIVQKIVMDDTEIYYNEFYWGNNPKRFAGFIKSLQDSEKEIVDSILLEILSNQLQPLDTFKENQDKINILVNMGLIEPVKIITRAGDEKQFLCTPHLVGIELQGTELLSLDILHEIKLFTAAILYGMYFSPDYKIRYPLRLLEKLLKEGEIGPATPIGRDYPLLEKLGIIKVEPSKTWKDRYYMVLNRKKEYVVQASINVLTKSQILDNFSKLEQIDGLFLPFRAKEPEEIRTNIRAKEVIPSSKLEVEIVKTIRGEEI